jgi:hypothetical protein
MERVGILNAASARKPDAQVFSEKIKLNYITMTSPLLVI